MDVIKGNYKEWDVNASKVCPCTEFDAWCCSDFAMMILLLTGKFWQNDVNDDKQSSYI